MRFLILLLVLFAILPAAQAQTDCSQELKQAVELYNNGLFQQAADKIAENLKSCQYTNEELQTAYRTIISSYRKLDEIEQADLYTLRFLRKFPVYKIYTTDPEPFKVSVERYSVRQKIQIFENTGLISMKPEITKVNTVVDNIDYSGKYNSYLGFAFNVGLNYFIYPNIYIKAAIGFQTVGYERHFEITDKYYLNFSEDVQQYNIPVTLNYEFFKNRRIYPSVHAGLYYTGLILTESKFSTKMLTTTPDGNTSTIIGNLQTDRKDYLNKVKTGALWGLSLNYNIKRFIISADLNFLSDFNQFITNNKIYDNTRYYSELYYIDNFFKAKYVNFGIAIRWNLYYSIKAKY